MKPKQVIKVEFKNNTPYLQVTYKGRYLEIRVHDKQTRFYEVDIINRKEYCLSKETVIWLMHKGSIPRNNTIKQFIAL